MGKKDEQKANLAQSMTRPGATPASPASVVPGKPARRVGLETLKESARIELDRIVADPFQPRKEFEEAKMAELIESIRAMGQLQPIRVRYDEPSNRYVILMGERRYRACVELGLKSIEAIVHDGPLDETQTIEIQLDENLVRDELKPIEVAKSYRRLMELGYTQERVSLRFRTAQSNVSSLLSLLTLPASVQAQVDDGIISAKTAEYIAKVETPEEQVELAREVVEGNLTRDQTAEIVKEKRAAAKPRAKGKGASAKPKPKGKTLLVWNEGPLKFRIECKKGIEIEAAREAMLRKFEALATAV